MSAESIHNTQSKPINRYQLIILLLLLFSTLPASESVRGSAPSHAQHRTESLRQSPIPLNPAAGNDISIIYEAFLSPKQEGGEEEDTPIIIPPDFRSSAPSVPRNQRISRGHAILEFTNDLSRAYVHLAIENVNIDAVNMLHLHCGRPGELGPILVDFSLTGNINTYLSDGVLDLELTHEDIVMTADHKQGLIGGLTAGCPISASIPGDKVKTIAGMEFIARQGELYFNLHTTGQTYFGDMRGQFHLADPARLNSGATP